MVRGGFVSCRLLSPSGSFVFVQCVLVVVVGVAVAAMPFIG